MFKGLGRNELRGMLAALTILATASVVFHSREVKSLPPPPPQAAIIAHDQGELVRPLPSTPTSTSAALLATPAPPVSLPTPTPPHPAVRLDGRIDINRATLEELMLLPGVGESRAADILAHRQANGSFRSVADLDNVKGFGPRSVEQLAPHIWVIGEQETGLPLTPVAGGRIRINGATPEELDQLDGVGPVLARRIVDHRNLHGPFRNPGDFARVRGVGPELLKKNADRILYD